MPIFYELFTRTNNWVKQIFKSLKKKKKWGGQLYVDTKIFFKLWNWYHIIDNNMFWEFVTSLPKFENSAKQNYIQVGQIGHLTYSNRFKISELVSTNTKLICKVILNNKHLQVISRPRPCKTFWPPWSRPIRVNQRFRNQCEKKSNNL